MMVTTRGRIPSRRWNGPRSVPRTRTPIRLAPAAKSSEATAGGWISRSGSHGRATACRRPCPSSPNPPPLPRPADGDRRAPLELPRGRSATGGRHRPGGALHDLPRSGGWEDLGGRAPPGRRLLHGLPPLERRPRRATRLRLELAGASGDPRHLPVVPLRHRRRHGASRQLPPLEEVETRLVRRVPVGPSLPGAGLGGRGAHGARHALIDRLGPRISPRLGPRRELRPCARRRVRR